MIRRRYRLDRRPGLPLENPLVFYPRECGGHVVTTRRSWRCSPRFTCGCAGSTRSERQGLHRRGAADDRRLRPSGNVPALRSGPRGRREGEADRGAQTPRRGAGEGRRGGVGRTSAPASLLPACGKKVRMRGGARRCTASRQAPHPGPLPAKRGEGEFAAPDGMVDFASPESMVSKACDDFSIAP